MQISLHGRRTLITGGSKGLGLAVARAFAESGAAVAIVARGRPALDAAAEAVPGAVPLVADVATAEGSESAFCTAEAALDILVTALHVWTAP